MASPTVALLEILTARREHAPRRNTSFDSYEPAYRELLVELHAIGGDPALDELTAWVTDRTRADGQLPPPQAVARQARTICAERELPVPDGSVLATDDVAADASG